MSAPVGSALTVLFYTWDSNGALYDPSPLPTIVLSAKPDGTTVTPSVLGHTSTGRFTATVFSTSETTLVGTYQMHAFTSDPLVAGDGYFRFYWEVVTADSADPWATDLVAGSYTGDEAGAIVLAIKAKTDTIGVGVTVTSLPVGTAGETTLVRGSSYKTADGRQLVYTLTGYPAFTIAAPCYWRAYTIPDGAPITITGAFTDTDEMTFQLTDTDTLYLTTGSYALSANSNFSNLIRTPNDTLTILESVQ